MNIRLYGAAFNRDKEEFIADFKIPNRAKRGIPIWHPDSLPITKKTNDLEVTLAQFSTGAQLWMQFRWFGNRIVRTTNYGSGVGIILNQQLADEDWRIVYASATAASGESHDMWGWGESQGYDGISYSVTFKGTFWQEEPAWKLNLKIARITNYPPQELWTVKDVPIPANGKIIELNYKTNIYGSEIELFGFSGSGGRFNYDSASFSNASPILFIRSPLPANETRLEMVEIKDNLGRKVGFRREIEQPGTGGRGATIRES